MSYIVLARKYRPQTFAEVYAQEHVTEILQNAIRGNRIAHAYLFTGPRGVGKTSMARILAKSLNCVDGPTVTPCNKCHICLEITNGTSSDVIEIDGASNTSVDDVRDLQKELLYAPTKAKYKIYIIDEVHMLSKSAFNALLKTLEEPPDNVLFIFATTEPFKVIPTIISRCQRYDFKRIPIEAIVKRLQELTVAENIDIDKESLYLLARKADGGLRDALSLLDQVLSYCADKVTIDKVRDIFGLIPTQVFCELLTLIASRDSQALLGRLQEIFESGADLQDLTTNLMEFLRVVILRKVGMAPTEVAAEEYPAYDEIAELFKQTDLLYMMSALMQVRNDLKSSANPYLILEMVMLKLCRLDQMEDLGKLIEQLVYGAAVPRTPASNPPARPVSPTAKAAPEKKAEPPRHVEPEVSPKLDFNTANLAQVWDKLVARVRGISIGAGQTLKSAEIKQSEGNKLTLGIHSPTSLNLLNEKKDEVQKILAEYFNNAIQLELQELASLNPHKVEIKRKTIDDLRQMDENLSRFIDITESKLV